MNGIVSDCIYAVMTGCAHVWSIIMMFAAVIFFILPLHFDYVVCVSAEMEQC